ncbi:hypothetical protein ACFYXH_41795 [Streptomyces sp. NPDC002730]|uniref:hypothetical protein n=1 Tax=Streptomyces sp. NPDC002730 TaxID=3364662 RepID=UPI00368F4E03
MVVETHENRARLCLPERHRPSLPRWSNCAASFDPAEQRIDGDALDAAISAHLQAQTLPAPQPETKRPPLRAIAVDGKVLRGSRTKTATAIQLLAARDHQGVVLAQRQVASKSNEVPSLPTARHSP